MEIDFFRLRLKAYALRVLSIMSTTAAGSGHPTSCLSAADIVAALFFYAMKFDVADPQNPSNDRFILSKGHAAPLLYSAWKEMGVITRDELFSLRTLSSPLEGHPTPRFAYNEAATGSLGCGLSMGLGMALSSRIAQIPFYTYVLLGDSEMTEGSVWEAIELAAYYRVNNLIAIVDMNRLGQTGETIDDHNLERHAKRWRAFGWHTICIDGHSLEQIVAALDDAKHQQNIPVVLIAHTFKGYGLTGIENKKGYHGWAIPKDELDEQLENLKKRFPQEARAYSSNQGTSSAYKKPDRKKISWPMPACQYTHKTVLATRKAFGEALTLMGRLEESLVCLDAEVSNSTYTNLFEKEFPDRFIQSFIAEQNMIGMAIGLSERGFITVSATFASFLTRAYDQIRMAAINRSPLRIAGSHAGVSIGQDGPSQMGLEDISMMRALPDSVVLYPCDAVSTQALLYRMIHYQSGISYLRLTRADTPVIYGAEHEFIIGGLSVLRKSSSDQVCIIAAGITLYEALKAYDELKQRNISASIIDLYSIKPLDQEQLIQRVVQSKRRVITVEDHYLQGGLGEAVCAALANETVQIQMLAVKEVSRSGSLEELLAYHEINHTAIIQAAMGLIGGAHS